MQLESEHQKCTIATRKMKLEYLICAIRIQGPKVKTNQK